MFEAFKVGVTVHLRNLTTGPITDMSRKFRTAEGDVRRINRQIETLQLLMKAGLVGPAGHAQLRGMQVALAAANSHAEDLGRNLKAIQTRMLVGGGMAGAGALGLFGVFKGIQSANDIQEAKTQLSMLGLSAKDMSRVVEAAFSNTRKVITSSVDRNIADLIDLRGVVGDVDTAIQLLPMFTKTRAIAKAMDFEGFVPETKTLASNMAKALDMFGVGQDGPDFVKYTELMTRVLVATRGMVNPEAYRFVGKYGSIAARSYDEDFLFGYLPHLMQDYASKSGGGGGHGGVGAPLMSLFSAMVQGKMGQDTAANLNRLGLLAEYKKDGQDTIRGKSGAKIVNEDLFKANPFTWTMRYFVPALENHMRTAYVDTRTGFNPYRNIGSIDDVPNKVLSGVIGDLLTFNRNAAKMIDSFVVKRKGFERDRSMVMQTLHFESLYEQSLASPGVAGMALQAGFKNFTGALFQSTVPLLTVLKREFALAFQGLGNVLSNYPALLSAVTGGFIGLSVALVAVGAKLLLAGVMAKLTAGVGLLGTVILGIPVAKILAVAAALGAISSLAAYLSEDFRQGRIQRQSGSQNSAFNAWLERQGHVPMDRGGILTAIAPPTPVPSQLATPTVVLNVDGRELARVSARNKGLYGDAPDGPSLVNPLDGIPAESVIY
jgi:hypothetical protein